MPVAGAHGSEVFWLKATKASEAIPKMAYRRPFEPVVAAEQTFSPAIAVR